MTQADLVITDFKNQIARLSEERALYFALATAKEQENNQLKQENEDLKIQLEEKGADEE